MTSSEVQDQPDTVQGRVTGIIYPPPDIRAVVDKTAQFVARNGRSFERKIAGDSSSTKFSFLRPSDPYHAYYEHKVTEFLESRDEPEKKEEPKEEASKSEETVPPPPKEPQNEVKEESVVVKPAVEAPVARAAKSMPKKPPTPEEFILSHPRISALDSDIIRLTAQYTAKSGKQFLSGLATREQRNPQFDFLKPTHPVFAYFTSLVEAYTRLLDVSKEVKKPSNDNENEDDSKLSEVELRLKKLKFGEDRMKVLDRCVHRLEWNRIQEEKKQQEQAEVDADRMAFQMIDWHDFVIVETITFTENDHIPVEPENGDKAEDEMDMDMEEDEEETRVDENGEDIRVVHDYTPSAVAAETQVGTQQFAVPSGQISGKNLASGNVVTADGRTVSGTDVNEHMRILLMDPKWRKENQRRLDKQKDTPFAEGDSIAQNLKGIAKKRADIFASSAAEEAQVLAQQAARRNGSGKESGAVVWDGHIDSIEATRQAAVQQQAPPPIYNSNIGHSTGADGGMLPQYGIPPGQGTHTPNAPPPSHPGMRPPPPPYGMMAHGHVMQPPPGYGGAPGAPGVPGAPGAPGAPGMPGMVPQRHPPGVGHMAGPPGSMPPGMPGMPGMPPGSMMMYGDQPPTKKLKTADDLIPEEEFANAHPGPARVLISVVKDESNDKWPLNGQTLSIECDIRMKLKEVKQKISEQLNGMPTNKQQLKSPIFGFLKDSLSLAHYNFQSGTKMDLSVRQRGGRR